VAACREILDRAYGKAMQPIQGTMEYGVSQQLSELFQENAGNTLGAEIARRAANEQQTARSRTDALGRRIRIASYRLDKAGKLMKSSAHKDVSARLRERHSQKIRVVRAGHSRT
jgi:hypothetical protein